MTNVKQIAEFISQRNMGLGAFNKIKKLLLKVGGGVHSFENYGKSPDL
jgi:hypothetical protein